LNKSLRQQSAKDVIPRIDFEFMAQVRSGNSSQDKQNSMDNQSLGMQPQSNASLPSQQSKYRVTKIPNLKSHQMQPLKSESSVLRGSEGLAPECEEEKKHESNYQSVCVN